ncbi:MAG: hypothetical protein ABI321_24205, partial [Polyangia bacterium]
EHVEVDPLVAKYLSDSNPEDLFLVRIDYASGESAQLTGNGEMVRNALNEPDVVKVTTGPPGWLPSPSGIAPDARGLGAREAFHEKMRAQLGSSVRSTGEQAGLLGKTIHHGTIEGFEASVVAGPKNVGKGFGGSGLYVAQGDERELATTFAGMAEREWKGRLRELPGGFVDGPTASKGVVLTGHLDPVKAKNMRVGTFTVARDGLRPKLADGVLPANWADDPRLNVLLENEFDFLVIRPRGLAIDTEEFLIVHESAAPAVVWDEARGLKAESEVRTPVGKAEPATTEPAASETISEAQRESDAEAATLSPEVLAEVEAHVEEGKRLYAEGDLDGAMEEVTEALKLAPKNLGAKDLFKAIHKAYSAGVKQRAIKALKGRQPAAVAAGALGTSENIAVKQAGMTAVRSQGNEDEKE